MCKMGLHRANMIPHFTVASYNSKSMRGALKTPGVVGAHTAPLETKPFPFRLPPPNPNPSDSKKKSKPISDPITCSSAMRNPSQTHLMSFFRTITNPSQDHQQWPHNKNKETKRTTANGGSDGAWWAEPWGKAETKPLFRSHSLPQIKNTWEKTLDRDEEEEEAGSEREKVRDGRKELTFVVC